MQCNAVTNLMWVAAGSDKKCIPSRVPVSRPRPFVLVRHTSESMPVARNLEAPPPPSPLGGSQGRWQRVKLGGWMFVGVCVLSVLCSLLSRTVTEVWGLFVPSTATVVNDRQKEERDLSGISSDKVCGDSLSVCAREVFEITTYKYQILGIYYTVAITPPHLTQPRFDVCPFDRPRTKDLSKIRTFRLTAFSVIIKRGLQKLLNKNEEGVCTIHPLCSLNLPAGRPIQAARKGVTSTKHGCYAGWLYPTLCSIDLCRTWSRVTRRLSRTLERE